MKKTLFLTLAMLVATNFAFAETTQDKYDRVYEALKSCDDAYVTFGNGAIRVHESSVGICSYVTSFNKKTTTCTMPVSMARKYSIFKTAVELNEAQIADMKDIEKKYCKTK